MTPRQAPQLFRTLWGLPFPSKSSQWATFLKSEVLGKGFVGIECCSPGPFFSFASDPTALSPVLKECNCQIIFQAQTTDYPVVTSSWTEHAESLRRKLEQIVALNVTPQIVNVHAGKDSMPTTDGVNFLRAARKAEIEILSTKSGCSATPLVFETHRQRLFHNPFQLLDIYKQLEVSDKAWLKLNADLSHFVVGLERYPTAELDAEFWPHTLRILEDHCAYIHARCCTPQSIQLAALAPENAAAQHHPAAAESYLVMSSWWRRIAEGMRRRQVEVRVCPEYGPPPYQPVDSVTGLAIGDLDGLVLEAARRLQRQL
jgi:hypothetical protein